MTLKMTGLKFAKRGFCQKILYIEKINGLIATRVNHPPTTSAFLKSTETSSESNPKKTMMKKRHSCAIFAFLTVTTTPWI